MKILINRPSKEGINVEGQQGDYNLSIVMDSNGSAVQVLVSIDMIKVTSYSIFARVLLSAMWANVLDTHMSPKVSSEVFPFHRLLLAPFPETGHLAEVLIDVMKSAQMSLDAAPAAGDIGVALRLVDVPATAIRGLSVVTAFYISVISGVSRISRRMAT